jgi:hypothetical protein
MMRIPRLVQVSDVQVRVHRDNVHVVLVPAPAGETEFRKTRILKVICRILKSLRSTCVSWTLEIRIVLYRPPNKRGVLVFWREMARPTCADAAQPCPLVSMSEKTTRCNGVAFLRLLTLRPKMVLFYHYNIASGSAICILH